jgi:hypothetical protein
VIIIKEHHKLFHMLVGHTHNFDHLILKDIG